MTPIEAACHEFEANPLCASCVRDEPLLFEQIGDPSWRFILEKYREVSLFEGSGFFSKNGWTMELRKPRISMAEFSYDISPDDLYDYFNNCSLVAFSGGDGGDVVAINLNNDKNFGKIFFANSGIDLGFRVPLIAESLPDWIQRTLANGPDTEPYFFKDDFIDMGPAVTDATEYRDIKGYFHP